jgi:hypothetical protein
VTKQSVISGAALPVLNGTLQLENCIVRGAYANQVTLGPGATVSATHSNVRMGGAGLPGTGNIDVDPLFVDELTGDLHLAPGSPCIDAGDPTFRQSGADFERDPRVLDGDGNGRLRLDMGADERASHRLAVLGSTTPGSMLTITTSGLPVPAAVLLFGRPDQLHVSGVGTLFVDLSHPRVLAWPVPPSSVSFTVPPGLSGVFHTQELLLLGGGRVVPTNFVAQEF